MLSTRRAPSCGSNSDRPGAAGGDRRGLRFAATLLLLAVVGCQSYDDARVLQALNQRGFGRRQTGDANEIYTVGVGDGIAFLDPVNLEINGQDVVATDGVIFAPLLGHVYVNGLSIDEIKSTLEQRYGEIYNDPKVFVRVVGRMSKRYYLRGEAGSGVRQFIGNTTVFDVVMAGPVPVTADLSNVEVIRADPLHPLRIPVDLEQMEQYGASRDNVEIREDDIILVHPNFAGRLKNLVALILAPIQPVVQLAFSVRNLQLTYDSFTNDTNFGNNRFGIGVGNFNNFNTGVVPTAANDGGTAAQNTPGGTP